MSAEMKTRMEVQRHLRDCILAGLSATGVTSDGAKWDCMEFGQASFAKADRIVTMNLRRARRAGWQFGSASEMADSRSEEWIEVQGWQLETILRRKPGADGGTPLAEDVAAALVAWFNGPALPFMRARGMSCLRVDSDSVIVYTDDGSVYQKRSVFTVNLVVPKRLSLSENPMDMIRPEIDPA